jgi:hypothetical protein
MTRFQRIYHFIRHGDQKCAVCNEGMLDFVAWKRERIREIDRGATA